MAIVAVISHGVSLCAVVSDWQTTPLLALALVPTTLLGYFIGMIACWPLLRVICSRQNGAPLRSGDRVMILSGPHKGGVAKVREIIVGQGGWELARLDLGQEGKESAADVFDEYSLLKIAKGERDDASSGSESSGADANRTLL